MLGLLRRRNLTSLPVLDFGCGTGNVTSKLIERNVKVLAADTSKEMLEIVRSKFKKSIEGGQLQTMLLTRERPVPEGNFGAVILSNVYHHLYNTSDYIERFSRILPEGGLLLIDHEVSDEYWRLRRHRLYLLYLSTSGLINKLDRNLHGSGLGSRRIDYTIADIHSRG